MLKKGCLLSTEGPCLGVHQAMLLSRLYIVKQMAVNQYIHSDEAS